MPRRCPPGVICIENMTIIFLISVIGSIMLYYLYLQSNNQIRNFDIPNNYARRPIVAVQDTIERPTRFTAPLDVLTNPFTPPLRDGGWFPPGGRFSRGVPINMQTRGFDDYYRQVGILTRQAGGEMILPLMGRPLHFNQNKWQFYTMSENNVKLPVSRNGRSCTGEYGCDDLFNGDTVYIEGYNDSFKVTIYDNYQPRYIPVL